MSKKTILFFSRSELTYLYGSLDQYLKQAFDVIHVAYSEEEAEILSNQFGIKDIVIFKQVASAFLREAPAPEKLEIIDHLLLEQSGGSFNLNGALQSNRSSPYIGYKQALSAALMYHAAWTEIFKKKKVDFFIHEPVSLLMNQMAAAICRQQGGVYSTHILVQGDTGNYNFIMVDHYNGAPVEIAYRAERITPVDLKQEQQRIDQFIEKFRSSYNVFFSALGTGKGGGKLQLALAKRVVKQRLKSKINPVHFDPVLDNIELFIEKDNLNEARLTNVRAYRHIKYDDFDAKDTFYFYPMHLEPEAVVLYWADGLYTNQVKLIENIAAQLPAGVLLYVKDHPHLYGYRSKADYERIQNIPNVKLLPPSIPGKKIIKDCKGVITINGTGGLEALLMNKHVITFGSAFYNPCKRVRQIKNIRDLRMELYGLKDVVYQDDDELYRFVLAFLTSQKQGFTDFYAGMHRALKTDLKSNAAFVAEGMKIYFNNYLNFN